jgi:hypothetical protein
VPLVANVWPKYAADRRLADTQRRKYDRCVLGSRRPDTPPWLFGVACMLAAVTLVRALLLQYLVPPESVWNLARIGLGFAVFALTARYVEALARQRGTALSGIVPLVVPIALVAAARLEIGSSQAAVLAAAASALAGGIAGSAIAEIIASGPAPH